MEPHNDNYGKQGVHRNDPCYWALKNDQKTGKNTHKKAFFKLFHTKKIKNSPKINHFYVIFNILPYKTRLFTVLAAPSGQ